MSAHELRNNCSFNLAYVAWAQAHFLFPQPALTLGPFAYMAAIQLRKPALQSTTAFPALPSFLRLPWYPTSAPRHGRWLGVQGRRRAGGPGTWSRSWPPPSRAGSLPSPIPAPAPPGRCWEPRQAPQADPPGHASSHPPGMAPRPQRMCDFRYAVHYITLWAFPCSRSAVTLWRRQQPPHSFPKSAGTFPLTLISI